MDKRIFVCADCDKNTRDNSTEMWIYCHKHFKNFIKRKQLQTAKQIFEDLEKADFEFKSTFLTSYNKWKYKEIKAKFLQDTAKVEK